MKDTGSLHLKIQEQIDCFATSDPLKEMSRINRDEEKRAAAIKWIALSALHGINQNAEKITVTVAEDGDIRITAEYRRADLPAPDREVGQSIIETLREITHIDQNKGKMTLALGIRDANIELKVKLKRKKGREKISLKFP